MSGGGHPPSPRQPGAGASTQNGNGGDEPQALVVTHSFDSGTHGEPYSAIVHLTGRRVGVRGEARARDKFVHDETVDGIVPGSGQMSITSLVHGLQAGEWTVNARLSRPAAYVLGAATPKPWERSTSEALAAAAWSWRRWSLSEAPVTAVKTRWALLAPLARTPAVLPGSFTVLGILGIVVALVVQSAILTREGISLGAPSAVFLLALTSGLAGAKLWSRALHPGEKLLGPGWAVDGFLVVAPIAAVVALLGFGLSIGLYLDTIAPGLFFAVAIGRIGCFFTGCCAGRCTNSRFGVWSSDRRIGARRIPTQLLESAAGLLIGGVALLLVVGNVFAVEGAVFFAAVAAYFVVRQFLLRIRAEPRKYLWRRRSPSAPTGA